MSRLLQRMVDALASDGGVMSASALAEVIYADDPEGGPVTAAESLRVVLWRGRRMNDPLAARIVTVRGGRGGGYRIAGDHDSASAAALQPGGASRAAASGHNPRGFDREGVSR